MTLRPISSTASSSASCRRAWMKTCAPSSTNSFGAGQRHAGGSAGDHRYLAIELSHDHSFGLVVSYARARCYVHRSVCLTYRAVGRNASYVHRSVPNGLRWRHDGVGEGPPGPAPRQGRTRAHPQRVTAAVPRSGHQPHRHGPALRGGPGVQAHGLPALHQQGRTRRRIPAPIRSRRHARSVRPHRPHTPRTTPRRLRDARVHAPVPLHRGGRRTPRPPAPRIPVRTRLQDRHRRAAHRNRPRSRRHQPRTTRRTTRAAHRRRLGPHPGPQQRILPHRRRHRRRPHRQRHPRVISSAARR